MKTERTALLEKIVRADADFRAAIEALGAYEWDFDARPVPLDRRALAILLARYRDGTLSAQDVRDWADFLELRDDIDCTPQEDADVLQDILHTLATPETEGPLTPARALSLIGILRD